MKEAPKTARFDAVVESAGRPEPVTLWTKPEEDRDFMRAVREKRVVTLVQTNVGTKKDFGVVGFTPRENASYLVFPKTISFPAESKIVGIKYDRLTAASAKGPLYKPKAGAKPGIPMREKRRFVLENEESEGKTEVTEREPTGKSKGKEAGRRKAKEPAKVKMRTFSATVVLTAVQRVKISVEAESSAAARKALRAEAAKVEMDLARSKIRREIKKG